MWSLCPTFIFHNGPIFNQDDATLFHGFPSIGLMPFHVNFHVYPILTPCESSILPFQCICFPILVQNGMRGPSITHIGPAFPNTSTRAPYGKSYGGSIQSTTWVHLFPIYHYIYWLGYILIHPMQHSGLKENRHEFMIMSHSIGYKSSLSSR